MSKQIDWSKAPADATHWEPEGKSRAGWMKLENNIWYFWPVGKWDKYEWNETTVSDKRASTMCARPTTTSWSGEGLPPVGVVCMAGCEQVFIVAHHCNGIHAIYAESESDGLLYYGEPNEFRPIRTPEQIAADEREAAIDEMLAATPAPGSDISLRVCEKLYDAGYRKP